MVVGDMTCRELVGLVTEYLEGGMDAAGRARFEAHLAECEGCVEYVAQMRWTIAAVGSLREEPIDPRARDTVLGPLLGWRRRQPG
jgi:anti-sigma factor RsiW